MQNKRMSELGTVLFLFASVGAAGVASIFFMMRLQGGAAELQKANPSWRVEDLRVGPLRLDDGGPAGEVFVSSDDAAAVRIERVACARVRTMFPPWFSLPDSEVGNCVRLGNVAPFTWVLNLKTATTIPEIWSEGYEKTARSLDLPFEGGSGGSGPGSYGNDGRIDPNSIQWAPAPGGGRTSRPCGTWATPSIPNQAVAPTWRWRSKLSTTANRRRSCSAFDPIAAEPPLRSVARRAHPQ